MRSPTLSVNWPEFQFDPSHSGCNPFESIPGPSTVGHLVLDWKYVIGQNQSAAAVVGGIAYVGSDSGDFYALNASTGALVWRRHALAGGAAITSTPAVVDGAIYITAFPAVYALG